MDDPSSDPALSETEAEAERERLFNILRDLVKWENANNERVLSAARAEIMRSTGNNPPPVLDPFCGGGSIPLESQRLGLEAHGSDLNPVAVLITKALIEIPPKFAGCPPVNPQSRAGTVRGGSWPGATGLAADVHFYGKWMREEAERRIGHLYPKAKLPLALGGGDATVIAWLWARTVTCPNPACGAQMPLVRSFALSTKKGNGAWVEPIVEPGAKRVRFEVRRGSNVPEGTVERKGARCIVCGVAVPFPHVRQEGKAGRMSQQLMAVVAEGRNGRIYLSPSPDQVTLAEEVRPEWEPQADLPNNPRDFKTPNYGLTTFGDLFTSRQLLALTNFSDLVGEARALALDNARAADLPDDPTPLHQGGTGATAYADAVVTYLGMGVSRMSDICNSLCRWETSKTQVRNLFGRQAIPMVWDFAEPNIFADAAGDFLVSLSNLSKVMDRLPAEPCGEARQANVVTGPILTGTLISTDPPYYDNIGYADLSDFFYVWLRRSLNSIHPDLFRTLLVPKADELIASPYRHGGSRAAAQRFFEGGLSQAFHAIHRAQHPDYPFTVYYAFKQSENEEEDGAVATSIASTGWETMLEGLLASGFAITGTWPMRTELGNRMIGAGTNALASSIVIVCRPRQVDAEMATRRDFTTALRRELPDALIKLQHGNVAPVDLEQAAIGPGMAIFSSFAKVIEADGSRMRVRTALQLINQEKDAYLEGHDGELDDATRVCIKWYEQYGYQPADYGRAETLVTSKNTSVRALEQAGVVHSRDGKVRLLRREELPSGWDPREDRHVPTWECTQQLIRSFECDGSEGAGRLLAILGPGIGENARALAYRLFTLCERRGRAEDALPYNSLVTAWPQIQAAAADVGATTYTQGRLDA